MIMYIIHFVYSKPLCKNNFYADKSQKQKKEKKSS